MTLGKVTERDRLPPAGADCFPSGLAAPAGRAYLGAMSRNPPSLKSFRVYRIAKVLKPVGYIRAKNEREAMAQAKKDAPAQHRDRIIVRPAAQ